MLIPDTPIRAAYITALSGITSGGNQVPIYDLQVPKNVIPVPKIRILLSTQTKQQWNTSKCGHNWVCSILLDIIYEQMQGYVDRNVVDDIEQQISDILDLQHGDIGIAPFVVLNTQMLDAHDMSLQTATTTITRKLVRYQHILAGVYNSTNNGFTYTIPFQLA